MSPCSLLMLLLPLTEQAGDPLPDGAVARLGTVRWRHGDAVLSVAFSPDGQLVATASRDGFARLWERKTGKELHRLEGHRGDVRCVAFSSDGKRLVSGGIDETVRLWDVSSGKELRKLLQGKGWIEALAFAPKGDRLAAVTANFNAHLWEANGDREAGTFEVHSSVSRLTFTPDGDRLVLDEPDSKDAFPMAVIRRWPHGEVVRRIGSQSHDFCLFPDGKTCAIATYESWPTLFDVATGKQFLLLKGTAPELDRLRLACSPDGQSLAAGSLTGEVRLWSTRTGALLRSFKGHDFSIHSIAFAPDGKCLATAGADRRVTLWDAGTGKEEATLIGHRAAISGVATTPDNQTIVTASLDSTVRWWDMTGKQQHLVALPGCPQHGIAISADGRTVAAGSSRGYLRLFDAGTRKMRHSLEAHDSSVTSLAFLADGRLVSGSLDRTMRVWDVQRGKSVHSLSARDGAGIGNLALSPDGRVILTAGSEARLRRWEIETGKEQGEIEGHIGGCLALALSPTGHAAVSGGRDDQLRLWEMASGRERRSLSGGGGWVYSAAWSPNGVLLASGHADGRVCLWDARSGLRLRLFKGHRGAVNSLCFTQDSKRLVSASVDTTALVWDIAALSGSWPAAVRLSAKESRDAWTALQSTDAAEARNAIERLAGDPEQTLALLRQQIRPVHQEEVTQLLADLDARSFQARAKATERLLQFGRFLEPVLQEMLQGKPSLEVRRRVEDILQVVTREGPTPEGLQVLRGLELLEIIGTDEAKKLLKNLAAGAPACVLTREAKSILARLEHR